jgi:MinD-like ATPase involved in chromosome partitioning or flagellar assembly
MALAHLVDDVVEAAGDDADTPDLAADAVESSSPDAPDEDGTPGRLVAVWGPPGAPGRTTVTIGLAAEAARRNVRAGIVDADPYGSGVGLALAVLEEVSGLLAAARLANAGRLEPVSLAAVGREVTTGVRLYTGLPRPDRWPDVRPQAFGELLTVAAQLDQLVVVDTGPSLGTADPDPYATGPARDDMTRIAVDRADDLVVVGSADPVSLTRLARALPEVVERRAGRRMHVVVNRMRPTLGWSEKEVRYLVEGVAPGAEVTFLPDDRAAVDKALVSGRPITESGDSPLRRAMAGLAEGLLAATEPAAVHGRGG